MPLSEGVHDQVLNEWFKSKDGSDRPEWLGKAHKPRLHGEDGEWELEWHPRSRIGTATMPARRILHTLKDEADREQLQAKLTQELKLLETKGKITDGSINRDSLRSSRSSAASSRRLGTGRSSRASSCAGDRGDADMRLGTARSHMSTSSRRSGRSMLSGTSTALTSRNELMRRIKGLEEAVMKEKTLREEMQALLTLETWAKDGAESATSSKGTARSRRC